MTDFVGRRPATKRDIVVSLGLGCGLSDLGIVQKGFSNLVQIVNYHENVQPDAYHRRPVYPLRGGNQ